ncbi:quinone oxidoreductase family protein [Bacillus sp. 1P06AnD]|uniref:quinone oxidoreductase family protein n=1 Tax=Bacillus sp. 1P06AnD TaxID=3132208 RepID=UPI00399F9CD9
MRAIIVSKHGGPEVLVLNSDVPVPDIMPKEVLIHVHKCSVNYADIKTRRGTKGDNRFPYTPGIDAAGIIVKKGSDVTEFEVGQEVIAFPKQGSYAEYVAANEDLCYAIPDGISMEQAAACPTVAFLAYALLTEVVKLQKKSTVLIHSAAGGVGTTAIQIARYLGASQIIGTVSSPRKEQVVIDAGADAVVWSRDKGFAETVKECTNGLGVDYVLDSVGGRVSEESLLCLKEYGTLLQFGNSSGQEGFISTNDLHASCRSIRGFSLGTTRKKKPSMLKPIASKVFSLMESGALRIHVGAEYKLEQAADAHAYLESRRSTGKIILDTSV